MPSKKRSSAQQRAPPHVGLTPTAGDQEIQVIVPLDFQQSIWREGQEAIAAFNRDNLVEAVKLAEASCSRHQDSSELHSLCSVLSFKVSCLTGDSDKRIKLLKNATDHVRQAASLWPNSLRYRFLYALMLYESAKTTLEEVARECERALLIENPDDPPMDFSDQTGPVLGSNPEARITTLRRDLTALKEKAYLVLISREKTGDEESDLRNRVPVTSPAEELLKQNVEVALESDSAQTAEKKLDKRNGVPETLFAEELLENNAEVGQKTERKRDKMYHVQLRPTVEDVNWEFHGMKKAVKSKEERRKEIEARVIAARILQQMGNGSESQHKGENGCEPPMTEIRRPAEERKTGNLKNRAADNVERIEQAKMFWNTLSDEKKRELFKVRIEELEAHCVSIMGSLAAEIVSEAISYVKACEMWSFSECCLCSQKYRDCESYRKHLFEAHLKQSEEFNCFLPKKIDLDSVEIIENGSWKPLDVISVSAHMKNRAKSKKSHRIYDGDITDIEVDKFKHDSVEHENFDEDEDHTTRGFSVTGLKDHEWPLCDDTVRAELLGRIQSAFQLLLERKCLAASHLETCVDFAMETLGSIMPPKELICHGLDQIPFCFCLLEATELGKVLNVLHRVASFCYPSRHREKDNFPKEEMKERIFFDSNSCCLFIGNSSSVNSAVSNYKIDELPVDDDLTSWLFAGLLVEKQLQWWISLRDSRKNLAIQIFHILQREIYHLQHMCRSKCFRFQSESTIDDVEKACNEEKDKRREYSNYVPQSFVSVLWKRKEELERERDVDTKVALSVIKKLLHMVLHRCGFEEIVNGAETNSHHPKCGEDNLRRKLDHLHHLDTCVEDVILGERCQLLQEFLKQEAMMMQTLATIQYLEEKLASLSIYDYRSIFVPLLKSFIWARIQVLVDQDALEQVNSAREALLLELEHDSEKYITKGVENARQTRGKSKSKKKKKAQGKAKDIKAASLGENLPVLQMQTEQGCGNCPETLAGDKLNAGIGVSGHFIQEVGELIVEIEDLDRKLKEALKNQSWCENDAKQKHLAAKETESERIKEEHLEEAVCNFNPEHFDGTLNYPLGVVATRLGPVESSSSTSSPKTNEGQSPLRNKHEKGSPKQITTEEDASLSPSHRRNVKLGPHNQGTSGDGLLPSDQQKGGQGLPSSPGQQFNCFAYSIVHKKWMMYDEETVKEIGCWDDVLATCERQKLKPQNLFIEDLQ